MKATKLIFKTKVLAKLFIFPCLIVLLYACDTLESDPDIIDSKTEIDGKEIYVRANNATFIDLNAKIKSNQAVKFAVTSATQRGNLSDLGSGILQYSPTGGSSGGRDAFEFTVYSLTNEVLDKDSIILVVNSDSTDLPCGVYPGEDYVYNFRQASGPILIDITANDMICTNDTIISIYHPSASFPPYAGTAEVVGNKIKYTGISFTGSDKIMYKIASASDPSVLAYGVVIISGNSECTTRLRDDLILFTSNTASPVFDLYIHRNDTLCQALNLYQVNVYQAPAHGVVVFQDGHAVYTANVDPFPGFTDSFYYELCIDGACATARVDLIVSDSAVCFPMATPDSLVLHKTPNNLYSLDVLSNDARCDLLDVLTITQQPTFGTATVTSNPTTIAYQRDPAATDEDIIKYKICNGNGCDETTVKVITMP